MFGCSDRGELWRRPLKILRHKLDRLVCYLFANSRKPETCQEKKLHRVTINRKTKLKCAMLSIQTIDPCLPQNGASHVTSQFKSSELVLRRGQSFTLRIRFNRPHEPEDAVCFIFTVEDDSGMNSHKTNPVLVPLLCQPCEDSPWNAVINQTEGCTTTVEITTPSDTTVAKWNLMIQTESLTYMWETGIYILFNPWCQHDQVYLPSARATEDAVFEQRGTFRAGPTTNRDPENWNYQQFSKKVLQQSLHLIHNFGKLKAKKGADCFRIVQAAKSAIQCVVEWEGFTNSWSRDLAKYSGSQEIFLDFFQEKKAVKCGQYWVYSTLLTTICRAVGIPAHTVSSNYPVGTSLPNYVWTRVWMEGGWRDVEATPEDLRAQIKPEDRLPIFECLEAKHFPGEKDLLRKFRLERKAEMWYEYQGSKF